jgi:adenine-specific DNA-methyltransferase
MEEYFDGLDPAGEPRRTYTTRVAERLAAGDERVARARDAWHRFVRESTGSTLETVAVERPASTAVEALDGIDRAFVATCYYDFLVETLFDSLEGNIGVTVANRDPATNTTALDTSLTAVHDAVLEAGAVGVRDGIASSTLDSLDPAALGELYRAVVPRAVRLVLGEYYTPPGVAELAVASLDVDLTAARILDPGCGAGAFLAAAIDAKRAAIDAPPAETVDRIVNSVVGIDLNPVAVTTAKLAYLSALSDLLDASGRDRLSIPVFLTDALGLTREDDITFAGERADTTFDALAGNPPWIPWERLPDAVKDAWRREYVSELGLQPHEGIEARLGHSNDDVSVPYAFTCIHRYLRPGGDAAFVLKRDLVRGPAGAVLRRLQVGERSLRLRHVHDFAALDPFPDAGADAALYTFTADADPVTPVSTTVWRGREGGEAAFVSAASLRETTVSVETELVPLEGEDRTTAWVRADLAREAQGDCSHEIRHGLKDDAAAVFGLDRDDLAAVETGRVFPYLRSRHVRKFGLSGHDLRLVPADLAGEDNEADLEENYPNTYDYLAAHRETLLDRASAWLDRGPFYTQFGLGPYTWAPYKVVWCRLGFKPDFAVASTRPDPDLGEKTVVPGDHYMFVATDDRQEAHFLCALLNSTPYQRTLRTLASGGKASLSKSVVSELALPSWPGTDRARRLAECSIELHDLVADGTDDDAAAVAELRGTIDRTVRAGIEAGAFGVSDGDWA